MKTYNYIKFLTLYSIFILLSFSSYSQEEEKNEESENEKKEKKEKTYSDIINDKAKTDIGLFDVHKVEDKFYYEINDTLLGRDMLLSLIHI